MPELPEVETIRAGLAPHVIGRRIVAARVSHPRTARRAIGGVAELETELVGARVTAVVRRGKFLWFELSDDESSPGAGPRADDEAHQGVSLPSHDGSALLAHLGMSGQFRLLDVAAPELRHERARLRLAADDGTCVALSFCDQRTFGYLALTELADSPDGGPGGLGTDRPVLPAPAAHIARDLLDPSLDRASLARRLAARRRGIKHLLLDQSLVAGVGNIYADEALWRARLNGEEPADALGARRIGRLLEHAHDVMTEALAVGGTSFDPLYVNVTGDSGYFARELAVYGREGEPCGRCGTAIVRVKFANRSSHFCPRCQRPPTARRRA